MQFEHNSILNDINQTQKVDTTQQYSLPHMASSASLMFLAWESPWPAHSGAALRTLGLLRELHKAFEIELVVLTRAPLTKEQSAFLGQLAQSVIRLPLCDVSRTKKSLTLPWMAFHGYPYHSAVLRLSLSHSLTMQKRIERFPGVIFTNLGHWGSLVYDRSAPNWILNQCDADVEFWRVYATQAPQPLARLAARVNYQLARNHYPQIYANVGRIISVCDEDRQHTLALSPQAQVDVIENGVDCAYLTPDRITHSDRPRLLFTGTSAGRNVTALRQFVRNILPLIQQQIPDVELLVAGNFSQEAQVEFKPFPALRFTGRVDDMRPYFNQSDVFVAPFEETHGSKLKIAEAMAMAMPIVSTVQGVRGFPLLNDEWVIIAHDAQEFAANTIALLQNPERRIALGQAARQTALSKIDWNVLGRRLVQIIKTTQEQITSGQEQFR